MLSTVPVQPSTWCLAPPLDSVSSVAVAVQCWDDLTNNSAASVEGCPNFERFDLVCLAAVWNRCTLLKVAHGRSQEWLLIIVHVTGVFLQANYQLILPDIETYLEHIGAASSWAGIVIGCCDVATLPGALGQCTYLSHILAGCIITALPIPHEQSYLSLQHPKHLRLDYAVLLCGWLRQCVDEANPPGCTWQLNL